MKNILIQMGDVQVRAKLNGSQTAGKVWDALPIKSFTSLWGEEVYFQIPVEEKVESDFACETVEIGDVGYWPEGQCLCLFFGPTPVSKPGEIRPASTVNMVGKILGDWKALKTVRENQDVLVKEEG